MEPTVGRIFGRALDTLRRDLVPFLLLALFVFAPVFAVSFIVGWGSPSHWAQPAEVAADAGGQSLLAGQAVIGMLAFLALYLLAGAVAPGVLAHLDARPLGTREVVALGLRRLLGALDVPFVTGILVGAGFVLFAVPGLLLAPLTYVAVPANAVERGDVVRALARSRDLTRAHRPALLAVFLGTVGLMVAAGVLVPMAAAGLGRTWAILLGALAQVLFGLFGGVCQSVAYHDLAAAAGRPAAPPSEA